MSPVLDVPVDRLATTLAPLRGPRTDVGTALAPLPVRVARRRHLPGARWLQATGALAPRGPHPCRRGRGSRCVLQRRGQGPAARGQHAQAHRQSDGRGPRGALACHRRSPLAHADYQAARPRARVGRPARDARPPPGPRVRAPPRCRAAVGHHRARPGRPARRGATPPGRESRAPRTAHPRGRGHARDLARGLRRADPGGAAARSAQCHAGTRGARGVPARAHGARAAGALPPDGTRPAGAHAARSHRLPRPRPPRPRRLPPTAGRPRHSPRPRPSKGARH